MCMLDIHLRLYEDVSALADVAADTDAADGPHGLGMQCHCTGVMPTGVGHAVPHASCHVMAHADE